MKEQTLPCSIRTCVWVIGTDPKINLWIHLFGEKNKLDLSRSDRFELYCSITIWPCSLIFLCHQDVLQRLNLDIYLHLLYRNLLSLFSQLDTMKDKSVNNSNTMVHKPVEYTALTNKKIFSSPKIIQYLSITWTKKKHFCWKLINEN